MSEPAHLADMLACGGRHSGWEPAYGTIPLRATIAVLAWPGQTLPVAAILCELSRNNGSQQLPTLGETHHMPTRGIPSGAGHRGRRVHW